MAPTLTDDPKTETQEQRARRGWPSKWLPWLRPRTRNAADAADDELLIVNRTAEAWRIAAGFRDLGVAEPFQERRVHVVKAGTMTARQVDAPVGTDYLIAHLSADVRQVVLTRFLAHGQPFYELKAVAGKEKRRP